MKIKKKTGILMLATAAVAATGVAAVSFAAWTGSNDTLSSYAATGEAHLFGFTENQTGESLALGTLVPYDQAENTIKTGTTIVSVALPEYTVNENYTITVSTTNTTIDFYVLVGAQQTAAPTGEPTTWTDWKKVDSTGVSFSFTASKGTTVTNQYLSLVMDSTDTADMSQTNIAFTVKLAAAV